MATLYTEADKNTRLTWVYITGFLIFVIGIGYFFAQLMGSRAILYGAVLFSTLMSIGSYWWSDKIVLSMSHAKEVTHDNARELYHLVENLCITAGLPVPKIYIIEDSAPNAFATGRNPEHGVICVTTGILEKLEKSELEGVLAHELSHIGNRDILLSTVVVVLVGFIALIADWFQSWAFWGSRDEDSDNSNPLFIFVGILLSLLAPLAATLIQLAISRKREYLADASAALLTRHPEGLARALEKISADQEPLEVANRATAHLYITNPFKGGNIAKLFSTHPPIQDRVARLRGTEIK